MSFPEINLLPWRSRRYQRRQKLGWLCLASLMGGIFLGSSGLNHYFMTQTRKLKTENQRISLEVTKHTQAAKEEKRLNTWAETTTREREVFQLFLRVMQRAAFFQIHFQSATFDFSGPGMISFLGVAEPSLLKTWLQETAQTVSDKEIQLIDVRKSLEQVQFEARILWGES